MSLSICSQSSALKLGRITLLKSERLNNRTISQGEIGELLNGRKEPDVVKVLSAFLTKWNPTIGGTLVYPKDTLFEEMLIKTVPVGLGFENATEFSCSVNVVPEEEMDEKKREIYRRLKGMECELEYEGTISKKPRFKPSESLSKLTRFVPSLLISNDLVNTLHNEGKLISLIRTVRPDELKFSLISVTQADFAEIATSSEGMLSSMARFYNEPKRIVWVFKLKKMITKGPKYSRDVIGAFNIVRSASETAFQFTRRYTSQTIEASNSTITNLDRARSS